MKNNIFLRETVFTSYLNMLVRQHEELVSVIRSDVFWLTSGEDSVALHMKNWLMSLRGQDMNMIGFPLR